MKFNKAVKEVLKVFPNATLKCASMFTFYYSDILGQVRSANANVVSETRLQ